MPWKIEEDKNGYIHVRNVRDGEFQDKDEAIKKAREMAIAKKTILRSHTKGSGYETVDFTSVLLPDEWIRKLESEIKISKAEYMIAKNKSKELRRELKKAKIFKDEKKIDMLKTMLDENKVIIKKKRYALRENKHRLKQAKRSHEN